MVNGQTAKSRKSRVPSFLPLPPPPSPPPPERYIGLPTAPARYQVLHSCLEELVRVGIVAPPFYLPPSYAKAVELTTSSPGDVSSSSAHAPQSSVPTATPAALPTATATLPLAHHHLHPPLTPSELPGVTGGGGGGGAATEWGNGRETAGKPVSMVENGVRIDGGGDVVMDADGGEGQEGAAGRAVGASAGAGGGSASRGRWAFLCFFGWRGERGGGSGREGAMGINLSEQTVTFFFFFFFSVVRKLWFERRVEEGGGLFGR